MSFQIDNNNGCKIYVGAIDQYDALVFIIPYICKFGKLPKIVWESGTGWNYQHVLQHTFEIYIQTLMNNTRDIVLMYIQILLVLKKCK